MAKKFPTKKQLSEKADKIAMRATFDNPVPIMLLGDLRKVIVDALLNGLNDDEVERKGREFIAACT